MTTENESLTDEQKAQLHQTAYYRRANETGELLAVLLQGLGTPLHAIGLIGANMVSTALSVAVEHDKPAAEAMRDEFAEGFMHMLNRLGLVQGGGNGAKN